MSNNTNIQAMANVVASMMPGVDKSSLVAALTAAVAMAQVSATNSTATAAAVAVTTSPEVVLEFDESHTVFKSYNTAGFTNKTLKVSVEATPQGDRFIIEGFNNYRGQYREVIQTSYFFERETLRAQLRLGVLKVSGRKLLNDEITTAMLTNFPNVELGIYMKK